MIGDSGALGACVHGNTITGQEWRATDDCQDVVTCLDCDNVLVAQPKGTVGSLLQQMEWQDASPSASGDPEKSQ